jgi:hypothetical protein
MFATRREDLDSCQPTATIFPAGTLFASIRHNIAFNPGPSVRIFAGSCLCFWLSFSFWSQGWVISGEDYPGELLSFIKADEAHWKSVKCIPRITSKGLVSGAVYKVSSQPDLDHVVV